MKIALGVLLCTALGGAALGGAALTIGQKAEDTPDAHAAAAKTAAGDAYQNLFNFLCAVPAPRGGGARSGGAQAAGPAGGAPRGGQRPASPDRSTWYAAPVKVFDNLYFV